MSTNPCIECSVKSCAHHSHTADYCDLEKIQVGECSSNPESKENTECCSFRNR